ncbi:MAG: hypothetical protein ACK4PR_14105, partial [Gammaproteobacteria bacterium]
MTANLALDIISDNNSDLGIRKLAADYLAEIREHTLLMSATLTMEPNDKLNSHLLRIFVDRLKKNDLVNVNENIAPTDNFFEALYFLLNSDDARSDYGYRARDFGSHQQTCIDATYYLCHYPQQHERLLNTLYIQVFSILFIQTLLAHNIQTNYNNNYDNIYAKLMLMLMQYIQPITLNQFLLENKDTFFLNNVVGIYAAIFLINQKEQRTNFLKIAEEIVTEQDNILAKFLKYLLENISLSEDYFDVNNCLHNVLNNSSYDSQVRKEIFFYLFQQPGERSFIKKFSEKIIFEQHTDELFSIILDYLSLNDEEYLVTLLNNFLLKENVNGQFEQEFLNSIYLYNHRYDFRNSLYVITYEYSNNKSPTLNEIMDKLEQRRESKYGVLL